MLKGLGIRGLEGFNKYIFGGPHTKGQGKAQILGAPHAPTHPTASYLLGFRVMQDCVHKLC